MRRVIAEKTGVRAGDKVRISVRLPSGNTEDARISIWERSGEDDFSPFVPTELISVLNEGKPLFLTPMSIRLHETRTHYQFNILADRSQDFRVIQETDTAKDRLAKARIRRYGKIEQTVGRNFRDKFGIIRRLAEALFWHRR